MREKSILTVALILGIGLASCSMGKEDEPKENRILQTRSGETGIQVTESDRDGVQIVRVTTTFRGQESVVVLAIDQPNYEIEIPLSLQQMQPQGGGPPGTVGAGGSGQGNFSDLLVAQYMEKSQESMLNGDYNGALRQINLILTVQPENVKAHEMKGSVYYAMGNYSLANDEWEQVLVLDPSNEEVRNFQEFQKDRSSAKPPPLPGSDQTAAPQPSAN